MFGILSVSLSIFLALAPVDQDKEEASDFRTEVKVLHAVEGGPLVLQVTLCYQGKVPIQVYAENFSKNAYCHIPAEWVALWRPRVRFFNGNPDGMKKLNPGDQWSEVLFIHHDYEGIPAGKAALRVEWLVREPDGSPRKLLARPSTTVQVDVQPATEERLLALRQRMEKELDRDGVSEDERKKILNEIRYTKHRAFIPVALRFLRFNHINDVWLASCACPFIYGCFKTPEEANAELVAYVCGTDPRGQPHVFAFWQASKKALTAAEIKRLRSSEDLWIKALTYACFPDKCPKEWTEALLMELRGGPSPLPAKAQRLIAKLDDERFAVREQATKELRKLGEAVELELRRVLDEKPSPEVRCRVEWLLDDLKTALPHSDSHWAMEVLKAWGTPEARQVLEALAQGAPEVWRTKEAKAVLERLGQSVDKK